MISTRSGRAPIAAATIAGMFVLLEVGEDGLQNSDTGINGRVLDAAVDVRCGAGAERLHRVPGPDDDRQSTVAQLAEIVRLVDLIQRRGEAFTAVENGMGRGESAGVFARLAAHKDQAEGGRNG